MRTHRHRHRGRIFVLDKHKYRLPRLSPECQLTHILKHSHCRRETVAGWAPGMAWETPASTHMPWAHSGLCGLGRGGLDWALPRGLHRLMEKTVHIQLPWRTCDGYASLTHQGTTGASQLNPYACRGHGGTNQSLTERWCCSVVSSIFETCWKSNRLRGASCSWWSNSRELERLRQTHKNVSKKARRHD